LTVDLFAVGASMKSRLRALGLHSLDRVVLHRSRVVLLTFARGVLRLHEGYASAPDDVLRSIVRFLSRSTRRRDRLAARKVFLAFPVEQFAPSPSRRRKPGRVAESDQPWIERLRLAHARLNADRFGSALTDLPIRLSGRMRRRLGHLALERASGHATEIAMNRRHVTHDPWSSVEDTLLHEMVHQWQAETGQSVNHGAGFRRMMTEVEGRRSTVNGQPSIYDS
jgi:hypothetical protein